jgi:hypothetical protein
MPRKQMFLPLVLLVVISAILHGVWETLHVPLYGGYAHLTDMPIVLYATFGDVAYVLGAVFLVYIFRRHILTDPQTGDLLLLVVLGFSIALFVEYKAMVLGKWLYLDVMPIIPILNVGLTPIVQMTLLLPLSVFLTSRIRRVVL